MVYEFSNDVVKVGDNVILQNDFVGVYCLWVYVGGKYVHGLPGNMRSVILIEWFGFCWVIVCCSGDELFGSFFEILVHLSMAISIYRAICSCLLWL